MLNTKSITIIFSLAIYSAIAHSDNTTGYNEICQIYTEAFNTNMPIKDISSYIFNNIENRVRSHDALEAHEAVMHADTATRYILFKKSAEHSLKLTWNCEAMKSIMSIKVN